MASITFDTLEYAKRLKDADVPEKQAEMEARVLREVLDERDRALAALQAQVQALSAEAKRDTSYMANKTDVLGIKTEVLGVKAELLKTDAKVDLLRKDMEALEQRLNARSDALGKDLTIKMGGMFMVAIGVLLAAMRYLS